MFIPTTLDTQVYLSFTENYKYKQIFIQVYFQHFRIFFRIIAFRGSGGEPPGTILF